MKSPLSNHFAFYKVIITLVDRGKEVNTWFVLVLFFVLTVRVLKRWDRLPRRVMEFPSFKIVQIQLDTVSGNLL